MTPVSPDVDYKVVSTHDGKPTRRPSIKVIACTAAAALTPLILAIINQYVLDPQNALSLATAAPIIGFFTWVSGYQTPPFDTEGTKVIPVVEK